MIMYIKIILDMKLFYQVSHCYPGDVKNFPQQLRDILQTHGTVLNPDIRMVAYLLLAFWFVN